MSTIEQGGFCNGKLLPTKVKLAVEKHIGEDHNGSLRWAMGLGLIQSQAGKPRETQLPAGSPAAQLTLHSGHFSFSFLAMPVTVPPVPDPTTTMWTLPAGQGREKLTGAQHGLQHGLPSIQDLAQMQSPCPSASRTPCVLG